MLNKKDSTLSGGKKEPTETMKGFINEYINNGGDPVKAWTDSGLSATTSNRCRAVLRDHWQYIEKQIADKIGSHVPMAIEGIVYLAQHAKGEGVKLKALQDLLSRAGYDGAIKIETKEVSAEDMDDSMLKDELSILLKKAGMVEELH